jgi:hypothetical protein
VEHGWLRPELGLVGHVGGAPFQDHVLRMGPTGRRELTGSWEGDLLRPFALPLIDRMRSDLLRTAEQAGFVSLLELAWTCHRPVRSLLSDHPACVVLGLTADGLPRHPLYLRADAPFIALPPC